MAKPMRKYVVGLRKILSGSTRKVTRSKLLARTVMSETMKIKMDEPKATLNKSSSGFTDGVELWADVSMQTETFSDFWL